MSTRNSVSNGSISAVPSKRVIRGPIPSSSAFKISAEVLSLQEVPLRGEK